ncbi:Leucine-rich repeat protein kinase family protein isoform 1 [Hibiscus syriacus]|uniref:Leucine-rich repeat protein kinase family protein isoform 1 n=1 Tax=Hibiscus syriacus TaxID=106335 RepID=A0A6A3BDA2_HIBSY|nr:Leucine-rich repeat protein kinase family protein isoform 1 [Hibiscus syriacus]
MNNSGAAVEVTKDRNGIDQILLRNPRGTSARVSLHGGQVLSWRTDRGEELLFTSSKAIFKPRMQFGEDTYSSHRYLGSSAYMHQFSVSLTWIIDENPPPWHPNGSNGKAYIDLLLKPSEDDLKIWPHSFEFRLRVYLTADGNLSLISRIRNINCKPFSFSIAYHTYSPSLISGTCSYGKESKALNHGKHYDLDINGSFCILLNSEVRVEGLETLDYRQPMPKGALHRTRRCLNIRI